MRVFLFALLLGSLVANAALFVAPYNWGNDRHPPGARAQQTGGSQVQSSAAQQATKIQIACEPNCAAKHTDEHSDEQWILRYLRKTVDDPVAGFTGLLFVATVLLALLARTQIRDGRIFQRAYINAVALGLTS